MDDARTVDTRETPEIRISIVRTPWDCNHTGFAKPDFSHTSLSVHEANHE